jgi:pimeloyl-ACP methyl ester carboxylesterase
MHEVETHYAKSNGGHVAYQVIGDGPRDVIFVPNWGSNVEIMWEEPSLARFLRRLATFSRLICFDKRGTGASDPVTLRALPTLEQWVEDVRSVMDAVGSERAVLIGDAEGGQMAMLFAATHPERVSALVLTNSTARHLRDDDYPCGLPARSVPPFLARMQELWGTGGLVELMAPDLAGDERFRRWYGRYERLSLSPGAIHAMYRRHLERDLRGVLPAIRVPTLVLHRAGNQHLRVGHGRYLAEHVPGAKYVELEGEDHFFHTGDTEAVLAEIGVRDRRPPGGRPRPGAGDGAVHRHRRLDEACGRAGRPRLARAARHAQRPRPARDRAVPRPRGEDGGRRLPRPVRRTGARDPLRGRDPRSGAGARHRRARRPAHRRVRAARRRPGRHRGAHRRAHHGRSSPGRGAGVEHREGPGRRLRHSLRRPRRAGVEGRARRVAPVRGGVAAASEKRRAGDGRVSAGRRRRTGRLRPAASRRGLPPA